MKIKRIAMSEIDEKTFDKIKKMNDMTSDEALSFCVQSTYNQLVYHKGMIATNEPKKSDANESLLLKEILEYVKLLVKSNKDLPPKSNPEKMEEYVNGTSRFDDLVLRKIKGE